MHCAFYMTRTIYGSSAFWEQQINKQRFCQKIVTSGRKANDRDCNQCMQSNDNLKLIHGFDIDSVLKH